MMKLFGNIFGERLKGKSETNLVEAEPRVAQGKGLGPGRWVDQGGALVEVGPDQEVSGVGQEKVERDTEVGRREECREFPGRGQSRLGFEGRASGSPLEWSHDRMNG